MSFMPRLLRAARPCGRAPCCSIVAVNTMEIVESARNGWHIVAVKGRVDGLMTATLERTLVAAVDGHSQVAVDCSSIDYISSEGLRSILQAARAAQAAGRAFILFAPSARASQVFALTRLHHIITITPTLPS
jgi:anti-sigma B factor antagonist